jgi:hypothetical protein
MIFEIIFFIFALICLIIGIKYYINANQIKVTKYKEQEYLDNQYKLTQQNCEHIKKEHQQLVEKFEQDKHLYEQIEKEDLAKVQQLYTAEKDKVTVQFEQYKQTTSLASEKYFENLETEYENAEIAYNNKINKLNLEYAQTNQELQKIKDTLAASIQARIREKEIQDNLSFYCLQISDVDKLDIQRLEQVKKTLSKPRVLSMLIWQTWFQKPLKALCANVLGTNEKTGIYKITNVETGECYIGQATNTASRWTDHAKCGLGIDTPANNKLYKAMQEYGLWSFSWELLEECPREQLNEKEKYYIGLYDSYNFGYNSTIGNK